MNIPGWVKQIKDDAVETYGKGLAVKLVGNNYYLYKRTSKRVKGKKYPQVDEAYIGAITRDGLVLKEKGLSRSDIIVCEYGFSNALLGMCPASWSKPLKEDWKPVLLEIIKEESPGSYLLRDASHAFPENRNIPLQARKLWKSLPDGTRERLEPLKRVYRLYFPDRSMLAHVTDEQAALAKEFNVPLQEEPR